MIIFAPRQQLREPAAEKGPEWSYRTPILIVCPCASARGAHVLATATASTSAVARIIRADFIDGPPRKKVVRRVSRAGPASENHPLAPLPSARRAERIERAFDREGGGEEPAHLRRRHDEGRARRQRAQPGTATRPRGGGIVSRTSTSGGAGRPSSQPSPPRA